MDKFFKGFSRRRIILIISLFILAIIVVILICSFTSQNTTVSNATSKKIAKVIEDFASNFFPVNHEAVFWRKTLNLIVRKIAHFTEYMVLGIFVFALIGITLNSYRRSVKFTFAGCTLLAMTDEFRQLFVAGRTARLSDVLIDITGAALGITIAIIFSIVIWKIINPTVESRFKSNSKKVWK
jgi:VanZ family protein